MYWNCGSFVDVSTFVWLLLWGHNLNDCFLQFLHTFCPVFVRPAVPARARFMVRGLFSPLGNWYSGEGSTFMIYQGILKKFQFEWKLSVKSLESGYRSILLLDHLCSRSRHRSPDQVIFNLKPVLKSWEPKIWLKNYLQSSLNQGRCGGQIKIGVKKPCFYLMNLRGFGPIWASDLARL